MMRCILIVTLTQRSFIECDGGSTTRNEVKIPLFHRPNKMVHKHFAGEIHDAGVRVFFQNGLAGRLQQMRFAQSHIPMNKQRIVCFPG